MGLLARKALDSYRSVFGQDTRIEELARKGAKKVVQRQERGEQTRLEKLLKSWYALSRFELSGDYTARSVTVFRSGTADRRVGIYMLGACDLPTVFVAKSFIREELDGTCSILRDGEVSESRSDFLLQVLEQRVPEPVREEVISRLRLRRDAFEPKLFEPTFRVPQLPQLGEFEKSAVILSTAGDLTRTAYRHRENGVIIDPGGYWLKHPTERAWRTAKFEWLKAHFDSLGKLPVEEFRRCFGRVVSEVQARTGAQVIVYNSLAVEPGRRDHNYQFVQQPFALRLREFKITLAELSRELDFAIVDVDRILKEKGVSEQVDFAHFPLERMMPIAREVTRILREREVI